MKNSFLSISQCPNFIIIGVQKSGTSTVFNQLSLHSALRGSTPKELHFFDREEMNKQNLKNYKDHFRQSIFTSRKLLFEATPSYFYYPNVPKRISGISPSAKFILLLRDPTERAFSAWSMYQQLYKNSSKASNAVQNYFNKMKEFPSFKEVIYNEITAFRSGLKQDLEPSIVRRGLYKLQLDHWLQYFPLEQFLILGFRDLQENPQLLFDKIYRFLNVYSEKISILEIKNKTTYESVISLEEKDFLNQFYAPFNQELFDFLGDEINW